MQLFYNQIKNHFHHWLRENAASFIPKARCNLGWAGTTSHEKYGMFSCVHRKKYTVKNDLLTSYQLYYTCHHNFNDDRCSRHEGQYFTRVLSHVIIIIDDHYQRQIQCRKIGLTGAVLQQFNTSSTSSLHIDNAGDWITGWIPPRVTWQKDLLFFFSPSSSSSQIWIPQAFTHSLFVSLHFGLSLVLPSLFAPLLWLARTASCLCQASIKPISCEGCDPPRSYLLPCGLFKKRLKAS